VGWYTKPVKAARVRDAGYAELTQPSKQVALEIHRLIVSQ